MTFPSGEIKVAILKKALNIMLKKQPNKQPNEMILLKDGIIIHQHRISIFQKREAP